MKFVSLLEAIHVPSLYTFFHRGRVPQNSFLLSNLDYEFLWIVIFQGGALSVVFEYLYNCYQEFNRGEFLKIQNLNI